MSKKIFLSTIMMMVMVIITNTCFAAIDVTTIQDDVTVEGVDTIKDFGGLVYSAITILGIVLSVIILSVIGIKYMLGSASERAEYKKTLMPYVIGCLLVFSASTIAEIAYRFFK